MNMFSAVTKPILFSHQLNISERTSSLGSGMIDGFNGRVGRREILIRVKDACVAGFYARLGKAGARKRCFLRQQNGP